MTLNQIKAEILTQLKKYDDLGLIDYITLNEVIKREMRRFGSNVMETRHAFVEIVGGFGKLPDNFFKLDSAVICDEIKEDIEEEEVWRTDFNVSRTRIANYEWDNESNTHFRKDYKEIIVRKKIRGQEQYKRYSPTGIYPILTKGISRDMLTDSCINKSVRQNAPKYPQINLTNSQLLANFREGKLLIKYRGLPKKDGEIYVPDDDNLENYLIYYSCYKMLETIWTNDEAQGVAEKMAYYKQEANRLKDLADVSVKFNNLSPNWSKKFAKKNRGYLKRFY